MGPKPADWAMLAIVVLAILAVVVVLKSRRSYRLADDRPRWWAWFIVKLLAALAVASQL
jgi:hypothetical protein